jgi:hypothetical protein
MGVPRAPHRSSVDRHRFEEQGDKLSGREVKFQSAVVVFPVLSPSVTVRSPPAKILPVSKIVHTSLVFSLHMVRPEGSWHHHSVVMPVDGQHCNALYSMPDEGCELVHQGMPSAWTVLDPPGRGAGLGTVQPSLADIVVIAVIHAYAHRD